ncbi:MAG: hypothetical protein GXP41_01720, partial [Chloroflexi bacterium]|nr:hypothetical protein [Chloroflexota bacterium]
SFSKSVDGGTGWATTYPPSPGAPNLPPTPTATPHALSFSGKIYVASQGGMRVPLASTEVQLYGSADPDYLGSWLYNALSDADGLFKVAAKQDFSFYHLLLRPPAGYRAVSAQAGPGGQVLQPRWIRYGNPAPGEHSGNIFVLQSVASPTPSPTVTGTATATPAGTSTPYPSGVVLNEFLPAPKNVDWDGDGAATSNDEWIELYNAGDGAVDLGGWQLDDHTGGGSRPYVLPAGTTIGAGQYRVFYKAETGVSLDNAGDEVHLLFPNGLVADEAGYTERPGYDQSFSRRPDGLWVLGWPPSPGKQNHPPAPTPKRTYHATQVPSGISGTWIPTNIVALQSLPLGQKVDVQGWVTVPPGPLGKRTFYIEDQSGGVRVYMRYGKALPLEERDILRVRGWLRSYRGEREIVIYGSKYVQRTGQRALPNPIPLQISKLPDHLGELVEITGRISGFGRHTLEVRDGDIPVIVYILPSTAIKRPWVERGQWVNVVGIVRAWPDGGDKALGCELIPRYQRDIALAPDFLPVTGDKNDSG